MDEDLNAPTRTIRLDVCRAVLGDALVGKLRNRDDDGALFFQRELETRLAEEYAVERAENQFASGSLLPHRATVPALDGQVGYYMVYDYAGRAKWNTGGAMDIPKVHLKRWRRSFTVHRFALGWSIDIDDIRRAELNGVPIEMQSVGAVFEGLDEMLDDVLFQGSVEKGIHGITDLPNITVIEAPAGVGGAFRWTTTGATAKNFLEVVADIESVFQIMRATTHDRHQPNVMWMNENFWARTAQIFLGNTTLTVRQHLINTYSGVQWRSVRKLGTAGFYAGPVVMGLKLTTDRELWCEVPEHRMLGDIKREDEAIEGYFKSYTGGVIAVYSYRIVLLEFPAD